MQHMPRKGMYLLSMHPRSLLVCRMFQLSSCLCRKQSFHTRLNSAYENPPKKVCQCSSISSKQKNCVTTLDHFKPLFMFYPLIGVGEGQTFGLSYTRLMTTDLLQYDIAVSETHHTTCSKHVLVDGKGLVSMRPSHVYFWMCTKHRF